jgi:hypothetical protein
MKHPKFRMDRFKVFFSMKLPGRFGDDDDEDGVGLQNHANSFD